MRIVHLPLLTLLAACADVVLPPEPGYFDTAPLVPVSVQPSGGHVLYLVASRAGERASIERVGLARVAAPENVTAALDGFAPGEDRHVASSANGAWLAIVTTRFGCDDAPCVALVAADLRSARRARTASGHVLHAESATVSNDARVVAYAGQGGPHARDVFVTAHPDEARRATPWADPWLASGASPFAYNRNPRLTPDGERVVFDCGDEPGDDAARSVCEATADGRELSVRVAADASPPDAELLAGALAFPQRTPDGAVVFESDWYGAPRLFRATRASGAPDSVAVLTPLVDVGSPCVLPDGRVAALWRGRAGNRPGLREVTVVDASGAARVLRRDRDATPGTVSCGP